MKNDPAFARSAGFFVFWLVREKPEGVVPNRARCVIVAVFREQARSYTHILQMQEAQR